MHWKTDCTSKEYFPDCVTVHCVQNNVLLYTVCVYFFNKGSISYQFTEVMVTKYYYLDLFIINFIVECSVSIWSFE